MTEKPLQETIGWGLLLVLFLIIVFSIFIKIFGGKIIGFFKNLPIGGLINVLS